jgi:tRNA(fMet)-specific endonuclease VapC
LNNRALLDTDILSYFLKGDSAVIKHVKNYLNKFHIIEISIITYYEIVNGLLAKDATKLLTIFDDFVNQNMVVPLTEKSCKISAELYSRLKRKGEIIDDIDLLIAGIAIENDMILITNNVKHFKRIPDLRIGNWKVD